MVYKQVKKLLNLILNMFPLSIMNISPFVINIDELKVISTVLFTKEKNKRREGKRRLFNCV